MTHAPLLTEPESFPMLVDRLTIDTDEWRAHFDGETVVGADRRDLESQLGRKLYERWHVRWPAGRNSLSRIDRDPETEQIIEAALGTHSITMPIQWSTERNNEPTASLMGVRITSPKVCEGVENIRMPDVWPAISPGFVMVFGARRPIGNEHGQAFRLYLGGDDLASTIPGFVRIVHTLRASDVGWQAKIASSNVVYPRSDAITIYLDARDADVVHELVRSLPVDRSPQVPTSMFVRKLGPGIGWAQEPNDSSRRGLSYGQHRSSIVARAALNSALSGSSRIDELLADARIDPFNPWRNS